ncbi:hypothetical protein KC316_g44 [Hortaea werneckii]|nr:hypothetical protein KC316_g44 [Hortaea werneckii]
MALLELVVPIIGILQGLHKHVQPEVTPSASQTLRMQLSRRNHAWIEDQQRRAATSSECDERIFSRSFCISASAVSRSRSCLVDTASCCSRSVAISEA